jgi:hypothetical protein
MLFQLGSVLPLSFAYVADSAPVTKAPSAGSTMYVLGYRPQEILTYDQ